jgi:hypothetical protein
MSALSELQDQIRGATASQSTPAPRTVRLAQAEFSPTWEKYPASDVIVGIRVYSEADARTAEQEAAKQDTADAAHQVLFSIVVARSICDPNSVSSTHPLFPFAEDTILSALTPRAIKRLFDEIEKLHVDQSPAFAEATDDDLVELAGAFIQPDALAKLNGAQAGRARRYARLLLDLINPDG